MLQLPEPLVPVGFQGGGHQPVGRIDREEPAPREVGLVADGLDAMGALPVGFGELGADLLPDHEGEVDVLAIQRVDHEA